MAYMNQTKKKELAPNIKKVLKKYGMKGTLGVNNYSTLVLNISAGELDLIGAANRRNKEFAERRGESYYENEGSMSVNHYWSGEWMREVGEEKIANFYDEIVDAMNGEGAAIKNHDNSDPMTDYFDVGWYLDINVGRWNKPFVLTA